MISQEYALQLIQNSFSSLRRSGLLEQDVVVQADTVLLGTGSPLDSMAFVTFWMDLEDRLNRETDHESYLVLVLNEIHEFNTDNAYLTADTLARYMVKLTRK